MLKPATILSPHTTTGQQPSWPGSWLPLGSPTVGIQGLSQDSCSEGIISEKRGPEGTQKASEMTLAPEGVGLTFFKEFSVGGIDIVYLDDVIIAVIILIVAVNATITNTALTKLY